MLADGQVSEVTAHSPLTGWPRASVGDEGRHGVTVVQGEDLEQLVGPHCSPDTCEAAAAGGTPTSECQRGVCAKSWCEKHKTRCACVCAGEHAREHAREQGCMCM